jgi:hypothetical protein
MKMKKKIVFFVFLSAFYTHAQSVISTLNSGSLIVANTSASIGEIIVVPETPNVSSHSGIIGILVELGEQTLTVPELELANGIKIYPNTTSGKIHFETKSDLQNEMISVYNSSGVLSMQAKINAEKTLNLETLPAGVYIIRFSNKNIDSFKIIKQ